MTAGWVGRPAARRGSVESRAECWQRGGVRGRASTGVTGQEHTRRVAGSLEFCEEPLCKLSETPTSSSEGHCVDGSRAGKARVCWSVPVGDLDEAGGCRTMGRPQ